MDKQALVIIPTYDEADNLEQLVQAILSLKLAADILIIDDNSPDGTGQLADALSLKNRGRVFVLHLGGKLGLGTAHREGFKWGLKRGYQQFLTMDADFSHPPEAIPSMLAGLQRAGMVIGSRYISGGRTVGWSLPRKINSWAANWLARWLMGLKARDCTGAFRAYREEDLKIVPLGKLRARGYSAHLEVLYYLERAGARVVEVPITFVNRKKGQSKISGGEVRETLKILIYYFLPSQGARCPECGWGKLESLS